LAREHYLRQQQRRAAAAARRRRTQQVSAVVLAVVLVVGGVAVLASVLRGSGNDLATLPTTKATDTGGTSASASSSASPSPSASPSAKNVAGDCTYTKTSQGAVKSAGLPAYDKSKAASYRKPFTATIRTNLGDISVLLAAQKAPCTANSFKHLALATFYDKTGCHRLTTQGIFVLQCGDPSSTGNGGPGYQFGVENAPPNGSYPAGTLAMARTSDPNSNGSQFFIVYKQTSLPDPNGYTVFGKVTKGLDIVTKVAAAGTDDSNGTGDGKPKEKVTITSVTIGKG
jgi:peptidyl-prolyl cis-trans isomerase B (cyclophilin B)